MSLARPVLIAFLATGLAPATDERAAYKVQHERTDRRIHAGDAIIGYKSGLMSTLSMANKGIDHPLVAPLFRSGDCLRADRSISLRGYRKAVIELKLGYLLGKDGTPAAILPIIDIPNINYPDPDHYSALDMITAGISSACYVKGTLQPLSVTDLDRISVSISLDGKPLTSGISAESLGSQRESLAVMTGLISKQHYPMKPGMMFVTGKIGAKIDAMPGHYVANYGPLGTISFDLKP